MLNQGKVLLESADHGRFVASAPNTCDKSVGREQIFLLEPPFRLSELRSQGNAKLIIGLSNRKLVGYFLEYAPANGAEYPDTRFGNSLKQIARLIKANVGLEVAFADRGGWDTHVNEVPQLANLLRDFGSTLGAFYRDMGDLMADVTLVTMSEFGRTRARDSKAITL